MIKLRSWRKSRYRQRNHDGEQTNDRPVTWTREHQNMRKIRNTNSWSTAGKTMEAECNKVIGAFVVATPHWKNCSSKFQEEIWDLCPEEQLTQCTGPSNHLIFYSTWRDLMEPHGQNALSHARDCSNLSNSISQELCLCKYSLLSFHKKPMTLILLKC